MTTSLNINGPSGQLEALWSPAAEVTGAANMAAPRCALLCHPHPQYGGSMHDGVLAIAADVLSAHGFAHLRFNFRGVGGSDGSFDNGQGERDDIVAAWNWLIGQAPAEGWRSALLVGYSFGAATAWAARAQCVDVSQLLLVAPPTAAMPFTGQADALDTRVIAGDDDSYCDLAALPAGSGSNVIAGADHFFSASAGLLTDAIANAITG